MAAILQPPAGTQKKSAKVLIPTVLATGPHEVFLTLDDGPHPTLTPKVLKILDKAGIKATFFMLGENARGHIDTVKAVHGAGHRIGNHSFSHPDLTKLSEAKIKDEISRTDDILRPYLGKTKLFRPPYGAHNTIVNCVVASLGYQLILWNVDTLDWSKQYQPDKWVQHGMDQIRSRNMAIVLNHDIHKTTADNYAVFIDRIRALGPVTFNTFSDEDALVA